MWPWWSWAAAAAALLAAACIDMGAPKSGIASISTLLLPSPSVVLGDVMRDSAGAPAPLRVEAFDVNGTAVPGQTSAFFVLDRGAHVDATGMFFGDSLSTVRVVGTIAGLQTPTANVVVTVAPDTVTRFGTGDTTSIHAAAGDSTKTQSGPLSVVVRNRTGAGASGFVIRYRIIYSPPARSTTLGVAYLGDDQSRPTAVDTTDASGAASRRAVLRGAQLGTDKPDSIVVQASVTYKGVAVKGSPVRFVIPVKVL
jgi:hypothetical protein